MALIMAATEGAAHGCAAMRSASAIIWLRVAGRRPYPALRQQTWDGRFWSLWVTDPRGRQPQPVVGEIAASAGGPLGVLDLQVEVLGRAVAHRGVLVRGELVAPGVQGPAEPGELGDRAVPQVGDQPLGPYAGEIVVIEINDG